MSYIGRQMPLSFRMSVISKIKKEDNPKILLEPALYVESVLID